MDMNIYVKQMIEEFWEKYKLDGVAKTPAACDLFSPGTGEMLNNEKREDFHTFVAKGLFASKRAVEILRYLENCELTELGFYLL